MAQLFCQQHILMKCHFRFWSEFAQFNGTLCYKPGMQVGVGSCKCTSDSEVQNSHGENIYLKEGGEVPRPFGRPTCAMIASLIVSWLLQARYEFQIIVRNQKKSWSERSWELLHQHTWNLHCIYFAEHKFSSQKWKFYFLFCQMKEAEAGGQSYASKVSQQGKLEKFFDKGG